eukprot:Gb_12109 [translate_table: standard]
MAKEAMSSHVVALHSLAVIQFNGSGSSKKDKDLEEGALCARATSLGQIDTMRDLGHFLQDGYGVHRNITERCRLLLKANVREAVATGGANKSISDVNPSLGEGAQRGVWEGKSLSQKLVRRTYCSLLSDFGYNVLLVKPHIANKFLVDWFSLYPPPPRIRLCSNENCGHPETR